VNQSTAEAPAGRPVVVGLDADDTLWDNESHFAEAEERFRTLADQWVTRDHADDRLIEIERANVALYGYGVKSFVLSMIEAAIQLSGGTVTNDEVTAIIGWGKQLLSVEPPLLAGVADTVAALTKTCRVLIITKGDLHHQGMRLQASGLDQIVEGVEIVAEKDPETYRRVLARHGVDPAEFVMVGNSVKSDVLPVRELGASAIHIPFHTTWALEQVDEDIEPDWFTAETISEVPGIIEQIRKVPS